MKNKTVLSVDRLPLVGGRLCLDFVNTTGDRGGAEPRERLGSYDDLLLWSRRSWILGAREEQALARQARRRAAEAARALGNAVRVREALYRLFSAVLGRRKPSGADLDELNRLLSFGATRRRLVATPRGLRWRWPVESVELDRVLWPIAQSAADLLTSDEADRLKRCGECDWLFLDESKNRSRRWCKKTCGDRVKARRYYRRHHEARERSRRIVIRD